MKHKSKLAQEEIMGFVVIMILVAVILMIFLWLHLNKNPDEGIEDAQIKNFVLILAEINTECGKTGYPNLPINDVIKLCADEKDCENGDDSCEYLEKTIENIMDVTWPVEEDSIYKSYSISINESGKEIVNLNKGIPTNSYKGYTGLIGIKSDIELRIYE